MNGRLKLALAGALLLGGLAGLMWQRQHAADLRTEIVGLKQAAHAQAGKVASLGTADESKETEAAQRIRQDIAKTRQEVAQMEAAWQRITAPARSSRSSHFTANRDPEKGPVRVEDFRNAGQATPSAAFQTCIWALHSDRIEVLIPLLEISPAGREKLQAMVARMDATGQVRFNPPEKIVALMLARDFLDEEGFEIGTASEPNADGEVKLSVLRVRTGRENKQEKKLPFQRGPAGWQLPIPDRLIDSIPSALESASMYVPPKRGGN